MRVFVIIIFALLAIPVHSFAETKPIQDILQENRKLIIKSSRKTIEPAIEAIVTSGLPQAKKVLQTWKNKDLWIELDNCIEGHNIDWQWVKGHSGHQGNERADELANKGIDTL